MKGDTAHLLG